MAMRIILALCVSVLGLTAGRARAERLLDPDPRPDPRPPVAAHRASVAFGTNLPFLWADGDTVAASLYLGASRHHAIRINVASYASHGAAVGDAIAGLFGSDGSESSHSGRTTDFGIGWVYYPRSLWSGPMIEAGALQRSRDVSVDDWNRRPEHVTIRTTIYAARTLIGWSWLLGRHVFVAAGAGFSVGRESGTETYRSDFPAMVADHHVARVDVAPEAYLRVGGVFGL